MAQAGRDDLSTDTEDETVLQLHAQGINYETIKKYKRSNKRLQNRLRKKRITGDFCTNCGALTLDQLRTGLCISDSFDNLKQSSQACKLCLLVLTSLRNKLCDIDAKLQSEGSTVSTFQVGFLSGGETDTAIEESKIVTVRRWPLHETFVLSMGSQPDGVILVKAQFSLSGRGLFRINSMIRIFTKDEKLGLDYFLPLDTRPRMHHKFELIKSWLRAEKRSDAEMSFLVASPVVRAASFPTRLVYLGPQSGIFSSILRLVNSCDIVQREDTSETIPYPPYLTLSHRWGMEHHCRTTISNLCSRQTGFAFSDLPKTYGDAVFVARQLGFEYMWIDSICIVQDDNVEWQFESEKMGMIFRNSACTIATHCSDHDDSGFLHAALQRRGAVDLSSCGLKSIYLRSAADLECDIARSPLSKRGWILQERFLSTRILHFTTGMIYFETAHSIHSEDGECQTDLMQIHVDSLNLLTPEHFMYRKPLTLQNFSKCLLQPSAHMPLSISRLPSAEKSLDWFNLLEMYSTCSLSRESDKLAAISGIATICRKSTTVSYLAGIWSDHLAIGLWWINVGNPVRKPVTKRASSWSWAAYDGPVQFPLSRHLDQCTLTCQLITHDGINAKWLNGPGDLTVRIGLLNLSNAMIRRGLYISSFREELYSKSRAWETSDSDLGQTDPIKLFNIYNARRLLWTQDERHTQGDGSWVVLESEERLLGPLRDGSPEVFLASVACFDMFCRVYQRSLRAYMVLLLVEDRCCGDGVKFRRVGAGLVKSGLTDDIFEERDIVLV